MSRQKSKKRLADLEVLSKQNTESRSACLQALAKLSIPPRAADIRRVTEAYPPLLDEIVVAGARAVVVQMRREDMRVAGPATQGLVARAAREQREAEVEQLATKIVHRTEIGSRVVELLDSIRINGKMLGDCTKREVLLEADQNTNRAESLTDRAEWLRKLGAILEPNQTVRTADRHAVLAILQAVT